MMTCRRCGAQIVPVTIYVEAEVAEEAQQMGIQPYIITTKQPMTSATGAAGGFASEWSWPCDHQPQEGRE